MESQKEKDNMIKMTFTITEEKDGAIRFRGRGENVGKPTAKEMEFTENLMKVVNDVTGPGNFFKTEDKVPLTIIKWKEKDEH